MPSALGLVLNWMFILPVLTVSFLVVPESLYANRHCQCCTLMLPCCDNLSNHFSLSPFAPPRRSCFLPMLRKYAYEGLRSPLQFLFLLLLLLLLLATGCCFARAPPTVSWLLLQLLQLQQPSHVIGACHAWNLLQLSKTIIDTSIQTGSPKTLARNTCRGVAKEEVWWEWWQCPRCRWWWWWWSSMRSTPPSPPSLPHQTPWHAHNVLQGKLHPFDSIDH